MNIKKLTSLIISEYIIIYKPTKTYISNDSNDYRLHMTCFIEKAKIFSSYYKARRYLKSVMYRQDYKIILKYEA